MCIHVTILGATYQWFLLWREMSLPSCSSHQQPIAPQLGVELRSTCTVYAAIIDWLNLVQVTIAALSSWMQQSHHVQIDDSMLQHSTPSSGSYMLSVSFPQCSLNLVGLTQMSRLELYAIFSYFQHCNQFCTDWSSLQKDASLILWTTLICGYEQPTV